MAEEHLKTLETAREQLVKQRRGLADALAKPYSRGELQRLGSIASFSCKLPLTPLIGRLVMKRRVSRRQSAVRGRERQRRRRASPKRIRIVSHAQRESLEAALDLDPVATWPTR